MPPPLSATLGISRDNLLPFRLTVAFNRAVDDDEMQAVRNFLRRPPMKCTFCGTSTYALPCTQCGKPELLDESWASVNA